MLPRPVGSAIESVSSYGQSRASSIGEQISCQHTTGKKKAAIKPPFLVRHGKDALFLCVLLTEFLDATGRVQDLLLARVEWVALGAHFDMQILGHGRPRLELIAATAVHVDLSIFGMNLGFHHKSLNFVYIRPELRRGKRAIMG
jgi:hypothetical protein